MIISIVIIMMLMSGVGEQSLEGDDYEDDSQGDCDLLMIMAIVGENVCRI